MNYPSLMDVNLYKVPEPAPGTASVFATSVPNPDFIFFDFPDGSINLLCGHCKHLLARGLGSETQLKNVVFKCPACQKYSASRV